jgi:hypothetical protein
MRMRAGEGRGRRSRSRSRATLALLVVAVTVIGCGGDDGGTTSASESSTGPRTDGPDLLGPGTEIAEGLVVPEGAALAGTAFRWVDQDTQGLRPEATDHEEWTAVLLVKGDPFAVYDDLAGQVRALGPAMSGTADACLWTAPPTSDDPHGRQPQLAAVSRGEPDFAVEGVRCDASASDDVASIRMEVAWSEGPRVLVVERTPSFGPGSSAMASLHEWGQQQSTPPPGPACPATGELPPECTSPTSQPRDTPPEPGTDAVPATSADLLPPAGDVATAAEGDEFGGEGNCFTEGYRRFLLPARTRLVLTEGGSDGASVLAVEDVAATLDALAHQSDPTGVDVESGITAVLPDGSEVRRTVVAISAGGGGCSFTASPDGRHVLITMHSD